MKRPKRQAQTTLGKNLKYLRNLHSLGQQNVADEIGIGRPAYASYEEERAQPNIQTLIKLSDLYGFAIDVLVKNDVEEIVNKAK